MKNDDNVVTYCSKSVYFDYKRHTLKCLTEHEIEKGIWPSFVGEHSIVKNNFNAQNISSIAIISAQLLVIFLFDISDRLMYV